MAFSIKFDSYFESSFSIHKCLPKFINSTEIPFSFALSTTLKSHFVSFEVEPPPGNTINNTFDSLDFISS